MVSPDGKFLDKKLPGLSYKDVVNRTQLAFNKDRVLFTFGYKECWEHPVMMAKLCDSKSG